MSSTAKRFFTPELILPNMPGVAMELLRGYNDDNMTLDGMADLVGKDAALAANVLRVANSARYSPLRSVTSLRDATSALGMTTLRKLTIATSLAGNFGSISGIDRVRFWRHGIATAQNAVQLAKVCMIDADTAYLGGLMMRTGQMLMLQVDKPGVIEIEKALKYPGQRMQLELDRWECTHVDVTAELARRWHFPEALQAALRSASKPLTTEPWSQSGAVLHLSAALADAMDLGQPPIEAIDQNLPALIARMRFKTEWLADKLPDRDALDQEAQLMTG